METKINQLKRYLYLFGFLNIFVISFTVPLLFGEWFMWQPRNIPVEMMMSSIYLAMGIVMIRVAKDPLPQKGLIDFLIVANLAHALVMLIYAENILHILFDAGAIALMGGLPLLFYPWGIQRFLRF
ncbi:MAG: hypothetical protein WAS33_00335 [Candidatus Promineifilaceae bacterium]